MGISNIQSWGIVLPTDPAHGHTQSYLQKKQTLSLFQLAAWRKSHPLHVSLCCWEYEHPVKDVADESGICK